MLRDHRLDEAAAALEAAAAPLPWTTDWPTEPGHYLFYGGPPGYEPMLSLIRVAFSANGVLLRIGRNGMLDPDYHNGAFVPMRVPPPDLARLVTQPPPPPDP